MLKRQLCLLPPIQESKLRIVPEVHRITTADMAYSNAYDKAQISSPPSQKLLKKSILQEAVQGKLVPSQFRSDEPAEALLKRIRTEKQRLIKEGKSKGQARIRHFQTDNSHYEKLDGVESCIDDEIPFETL